MSETEIDGKGCIIIIGIGLLAFLVLKGVSSAVSWLVDLPWYFYIPVAGILAYTIFKIGQYYNWWS